MNKGKWDKNEKDYNFIGSVSNDGGLLEDYAYPLLPQCYLIDEDSSYLWGGISTFASDGSQFAQFRTLLSKLGHYNL